MVTNRSKGKKAAVADAVTELQDALKGAGPHMGDIVWIEMSDVDVERDALRQQFAAAGLPASLITPDPDAQSALGRAVGRYRESGRGIFLRRPQQRGREVMIVQQHGEAFDVLATVDVDGSQLRIARRAGANGQLEPVVKEIEREFDHHLRCARGSEVSHVMVTTILSWCGGIRLKENGHVYWVPAAGAQDLRAMKGVADGLGDSHVTVIPVHATDESRAALQRAATQSFEAELRKANEELDAFAESAKDTRSSTLERRLAEFADLREKVELYSDILERQKGRLLKGLEGAAERCRGLIAGLE
jgi:hypothetical protein